MRQWHSRLLERRLRGDEGFTLIELLVTMTIIGAVLLGLVGLQVAALQGINEAKQRQQGTAFGNQVMEQLRSLPYEKVLKGNNPVGLTDDPAGCCDLLGETVVATNLTETAAAPLAGAGGTNDSPFSDPSGGTTYTARTYVSRASGAAAGSPVTLNVFVTWTYRSGKAGSLVFRSTAFSPTGCLSPEERPFEAPCQTYLYADSTVSPLTVDITDLSGSFLPSGATSASVQSAKPALQAGIEAEQTTRVQAQGVTGRANRSQSNAAAEQRGGVVAVTQAGDDPANLGVAPPTSGPTAVNQSNAAAMTLATPAGSFTVSPSTSDAGTVVSTVAATATNCLEPEGAAMTNRVCSRSVVRQGAESATQLTLSALAGRVFSVSRVAATPSGSLSDPLAWTGRYLTAGASRCLPATGAGCVSALARRSLGTTRFGMLPATSGSGESRTGVSDSYGLVGFNPFVDSVGTESGANTSATASLSRAGIIYYRNSSSPNDLSVTLNTVNAPLSRDLGPATARYANNVNVTVQGTLAVNPPQQPTTATDPTCATLCVKQAVGATVVANLTYTFTGSVTGAFKVRLDLGVPATTTSYKAAPGG